MLTSFDGKLPRRRSDDFLTGRNKMLTGLRKMWSALMLEAWYSSGTQDITVVCALHLYQFTVMAFQPSAADATCIRALFDILRLFISEDGTEYIYGFVYGAVALALVGAFAKVGWARVAMLIPQQMVLAGMAYGGFIATIHGRYLDGTTVPAAHISVDQSSYIALCAVHLLAILRRAKVQNG